MAFVVVSCSEGNGWNVRHSMESAGTGIMPERYCSRIPHQGSYPLLDSFLLDYWQRVDACQETLQSRHSQGVRTRCSLDGSADGGGDGDDCC